MSDLRPSGAARDPLRGEGKAAEEAYREDLKAFVDRELPALRAVMLRLHLRRCASCREELAWMRRLTHDMAAIEEPLPASELRDRILSNLPPPERAAVRARPTYRRPIAGFALGAAATVAVAAGLFALRGGGDGTTITKPAQSANPMSGADRNRVAANTPPGAGGIGHNGTSASGGLRAGGIEHGGIVRARPPVEQQQRVAEAQAEPGDEVSRRADEAFKQDWSKRAEAEAIPGQSLQARPGPGRAAPAVSGPRLGAPAASGPRLAAPTGVGPTHMSDSAGVLRLRQLHAGPAIVKPAPVQIAEVQIDVTVDNTAAARRNLGKIVAGIPAESQIRIEAGTAPRPVEAPLTYGAAAAPSVRQRATGEPANGVAAVSPAPPAPASAQAKSNQEAIVVLQAKPHAPAPSAGAASAGGAPDLKSADAGLSETTADRNDKSRSAAAAGSMMRTRRRPSRVMARPRSGGPIKVEAGSSTGTPAESAPGGAADGLRDVATITLRVAEGELPALMRGLKQIGSVHMAPAVPVGVEAARSPGETSSRPAGGTSGGLLNKSAGGLFGGNRSAAGTETGRQEQRLITVRIRILRSTKPPAQAR
jgi:hypothetical protein